MQGTLSVMISLAEYEATFDKTKKNYQVFQVLKDMQWHCRQCEYQHIGSTQIAGGGGIQGLERGTGSRPGVSIESADHFCVNCGAKTRHDRWLGSFQISVQGRSMSMSFVRKAMQLFESRDVVENTERPIGQLTVDHKLPMIRWNEDTSDRMTDYTNMSEDDIKTHFQLLKKSNGSVSHNLLKSRACERCYQSGHRGEPFGISFFYMEGPRWEPSDKKDPAGCFGCGWYDFAKWREHLNQLIKNS